ncbi:MAG: hypothetical protein AAGC57_15360, partial [Pseudomonadota bacterium]
VAEIAQPPHPIIEVNDTAQRCAQSKEPPRHANLPHQPPKNSASVNHPGVEVPKGQQLLKAIKSSWEGYKTYAS